MAILNKDTSIGDISDVYDRLNSISTTGGGRELRNIVLL